MCSYWSQKSEVSFIRTNFIFNVEGSPTNANYTLTSSDAASKFSFYVSFNYKRNYVLKGITRIFQDHVPAKSFFPYFSHIHTHTHTHINLFS